MPFSLESNTDFDALRIKIGGKLDTLPGLLNLRYRLNTEKAKQALTSIASADELSIFIDRMRALLVPQRLANGKVSTKALKAVSVIFQDGNQEDAAAQSGKSKKKKV